MDVLIKDVNTLFGKRAISELYFRLLDVRLETMADKSNSVHDYVSNQANGPKRDEDHH